MRFNSKENERIRLEKLVKKCLIKISEYYE